MGKPIAKSIKKRIVERICKALTEEFKAMEPDLEADEELASENTWPIYLMMNRGLHSRMVVKLNVQFTDCKETVKE